MVCSDLAQVGADIVDVYGSVERISIASVQPPTRRAEISDRATIEAMAEMLLSEIVQSVTK